jgi:hypothetical protein
MKKVYDNIIGKIEAGKIVMQKQLAEIMEEKKSKLFNK